VSCGLLTFFVLLAIYRTAYKQNARRSHLFDVVLRKIRLWVYLTMVFVSLKVISWKMPPTVLDSKPADTALTYVLIVLIGILFIETVSSLFYDFVLADRKHLEIPALYRDITRIVLYAILAFVLIKVAGYDVSALITGGTILTVVIGFATQESLGNLFAGIFLHGSRPFVRGDWVAFGDKEGMVDKIDWRATTIRTNNGDYVIFPNAAIAKMELINYSAPTKLHAMIAKVGVHYQHAPGKIRRILVECALKTAKVQHQPHPIARVINYADSAIEYELKYWITDFEDHPNIQANVLEKMWYHFKREDVEIPFPIRTVQIFRPEKVDVESVNYKLLKRIDFLSEFPESDMKYLASRLKVLTYTAGEPIIHQGEAGRSFYIVKEGRVEIQARDADGKLFFTKELGPSTFFGEISLLTGEPRTATVVALEESELLRLDKEAFRKIMEGNPKADELISTVLARRQEYSAEKKAARNTQVAVEETDSTSSTRAIFVKKIRDFFSY
jgi:small-conductance mechanosensitive channel/CRP-like cAMP-binding protein